jgi:hypothetical protein
MTITNKHLNHLKAFWESKQDLEAYCDFDKIRDDLRHQHPKIYFNWLMLKDVKRAMDDAFSEVPENDN